MELNKKRNGFLRTSIREVDEANLTITHTINTKALDRYSTIVLPKGADVKHFLNNAVVLWSHNMDEATPKIPIGRCIDLDIREDEIVTTTEFNKNDPLAVKVFNAYKDGFLHAWSIGFMPLKYKRYDEENMEDLNKKYGLNVTREQIDDADFWGVYLIYKWELLEYSAVPVPGNPEALSADGAEKYKRELVTRGLVDEKSAKEMDVREMLRRDEEEEKPEEDQTEEEATEENEEPKEDKPEGEEVPDSNKSEEEAEEEAPAEEESTEETESEEEETPEEDEESEEETESSEEEDPEDEAEAEEAEEESDEESEEDESEEAESEEDEEESDESTEDDSDESETVAKDTDKETEEEQKPDDKKALETKVDELTQRNQELSERLAKMEEKINEMSRVSKILDEIKETLDVDNIDKVRDAAQKRKGHNPDTWFSNYLRGNR